MNPGTRKSISCKRRDKRLAYYASVLALVFCIPLCSALAQEPDELDRLKESIKREILQELRGEIILNSLDESNIEKFRQEIIQEILDELQNDTEKKRINLEATDTKQERSNQEETLEIPRESHQQEHQQLVRSTAESFGDAEGSILRKGNGLPGCQVKLVALLGTSGRFRGRGEGNEYITVTEEDGKYRFEKIPVGPYKLKWQLPGDTGWIRRLRNQPDVTIIADELSNLNPIEITKGYLNH